MLLLLLLLLLHFPSADTRLLFSAAPLKKLRYSVVVMGIDMYRKGGDGGGGRRGGRGEKGRGEEQRC